MTRTKESLPINWITSCLSNYLLLVSSTTATKKASRVPQGSSLTWLEASHSHNSPWSTMTTARAPATPQGLTSAACTPLAKRSPIYVSRAQDPLYPTPDQLPFPQATQTQLTLFLPKPFPPPTTLNFWSTKGFTPE